MLLLTSTSDLVNVVTDATAAVKCHASWVDNLSGSITPGRTNTASITTATTTTIVPSPAASTQRNIKYLGLTNDHASTQVTVTVQHTDGTNVEVIAKVILLAGEKLQLDANGQWHHFDANGAEYTGFAAASQADMEAATSTTTVVTPGRMKFHPGVAKFVCEANGTATYVSQTPPAYNLTSITDNGTGDLTVTFATAFSAATWCLQVSAEMVSTTLTEAGGNIVHEMIRTDGLATGSCRVQSADFTGTTHVLRDAVSFHVCGYGDQ